MIIYNQYNTVHTSVLNDGNNLKKAGRKSFKSTIPASTAITPRYEKNGQPKKNNITASRESGVNKYNNTE